MARPTATYEPKPTESPSQTVIRAVADVRNERPTEMDQRLYDVVDPDALDALVRSDSGDALALAGGEPDGPDPSGVTVAFSFADLHLVLDHTGRVFVSEQAEGSNLADLARSNQPVASVGSR